MSSMPNIGNLKRVVSKKIRQTVRRLEKNLENLGRVANPVPQAARIPVPVHIPVPQDPRILRYKSCSWHNIIPCVLHLLSLTCCPQQPTTPQTRHRQTTFQIGNIQLKYLRKPALYPRHALFGSSVSKTIAMSMYGTRLATAGAHADFHSTRFYSTYSNFTGQNFNTWRWAKINQSMMFKQFSSRAHFHLQKFLTFYRLPTLTQILKKRSYLQGEFEPRGRLWNIYSELAKNSTRVNIAETVAKTLTATTLRLNASLTQGFHDMVQVLAKEGLTISEGCYVDFKLQPLVLIPEKTMMTSEVLAELLSNLKHFERHLQQLQQDIGQLSDLGELPLRFVSEDNVIRVYFPNCDRERLQILLKEKNICSGVIYEDFKKEAAELDRFSNVSSVSENDILSSYYLSLVESSSSESEDSNVLSMETSSSEFEKNLPGNMLPIHLGGVAPSQSGHIQFAEDSYCWA